MTEKLFIGALCTMCLASCGEESVATETVLPSGIRRQEVRLDDQHRLWIYRPEGKATKRPLVLIAPAGSPLFLGMSLSDEDVPEHEPYVRAGCIVVAYDVSGPEPKTEDEISAAIEKFMEADGGIADGRKALDYALSNIPEIDPNRIMTAGHSSSATIALQLARAEPRINACIAYAPCADTVDWLKAELPQLEATAAGFDAFIRRTSPLQHASDLKKPCFLFLAADDDVIDLDAAREFAKRASGTKLSEVSSGGHYDSMIADGIPRALKWMEGMKLLSP